MGIEGIVFNTENQVARAAWLIAKRLWLIDLCDQIK